MQENGMKQRITSMNKKTITTIAIVGVTTAVLAASAFLQYPFAKSLAEKFTSQSPLATMLLSMKSELSKEEIEDLLQMREEEKLAHDVYITLGEKWNLPMFNNIAASELQHTTQVKNLLDTYNIPDPVKTSEIGVFTDSEMKKLYESLVEKGSASIVEAIKVGALIEDLDIADLDKALERTDKADIVAIYQNLRAGSENHMRAFVGQLTRYNETYTPTYIDELEYQRILNDSQGNRQGQARPNGGRGGRNNGMNRAF